MRSPGWRQWAVIAAFVLALTVTGLFAVRTVRRTIYWRYHPDEAIRPWMSLPYVAHSYRVRPRVLYEALGIPHPPRDRRPIREIAREQNRSVDEVIARLQHAINQERLAQPASSPPPPDHGRSP